MGSYFAIWGSQSRIDNPDGQEYSPCEVKRSEPGLGSCQNSARLLSVIFRISDEISAKPHDGSWDTPEGFRGEWQRFVEGSERNWGAVGKTPNTPPSAQPPRIYEMEPARPTTPEDLDAVLEAEGIDEEHRRPYSSDGSWMEESPEQVQGLIQRLRANSRGHQKRGERRDSKLDSADRDL